MIGEFFKNSADLCIAAMVVAAGSSDAVLTAGTATTGLIKLLASLRKSHGPECVLVQARIKAQLEAKYLALAESPEFAGEIDRASEVMGVMQQCPLPLEDLAQTAFDAEGFAPAAERALLKAMPFDQHERDEDRLSVQIVAEAIRAGLAAGFESPKFRAALSDMVVLATAPRIGFLESTVGEVGLDTKEMLTIVRQLVREPQAVVSDTSRDVLDHIATLFGHANADALKLPALQEFLTSKASEYKAAFAEVEALRGITPLIDNVLSEVEAALERLDLSAAEALLAGVRETTAEMLRKPLEDNARVMEAEARVALLGGKTNRAFSTLSAAADSFGCLSESESAIRRIRYSKKLHFHSLRFGGNGSMLAAQMLIFAIEALEAQGEHELWAMAKIDYGNTQQTLGSRCGSDERLVYLSNAELAFEDAIDYFKDTNLAEYANAQNNLANVFRSQAQSKNGPDAKELLLKSINLYNLVRDSGFTSENFLLPTHCNIISVLADIAEYDIENSRIILEEAINEFNKFDGLYLYENYKEIWIVALIDSGRAYMYLSMLAQNEAVFVSQISEAEKNFVISMQISENIDNIEWARAACCLARARIAKYFNDSSLESREFLIQSLTLLKLSLSKFDSEYTHKYRSMVEIEISAVHAVLNRQ